MSTREGYAAALGAGLGMTFGMLFGAIAAGSTWTQGLATLGAGVLGLYIIARMIIEDGRLERELLHGGQPDDEEPERAPAMFRDRYDTGYRDGYDDAVAHDGNREAGAVQAGYGLPRQESAGCTMSLYAVQVLTGQEAEVCRRLADRRIATLLPQERRLIRRGGAWREEPYTLFRGYVFVDTEAPLPIYYTVRGQDGVMRWLGASPGTPEALSLAEAVNIRWLAGQDLRPSTAREVMPGVLGFVDGPLAQLSDRIVRVDRHDRRAVVALPIGGEAKEFTLTFTIQETADCGAAGSPRPAGAADRSNGILAAKTAENGEAYPAKRGCAASTV